MSQVVDNESSIIGIEVKSESVRVWASDNNEEHIIAGHPSVERRKGQNDVINFLKETARKWFDDGRFEDAQKLKLFADDLSIMKYPESPPGCRFEISKEALKKLIEWYEDGGKQFLDA